MRDGQKIASKEFLDFLRAYHMRPIIEDTNLPVRLRKCFKRYYPLLLLEQGIGRQAPWTDKKKSNEFRLYFREAISDICQSIVLAAQGFYKPSQLSLRSGLENWFRCMGLAEGQVVLSLTSVYELIDLVATLPFFSRRAAAKPYFDTLRNRYALLCGYVHTSSAAHMALTTAAGAFPRYLEKDADVTFAAIEEVCGKITSIFCLLAERTYRGLHHSHFDLVNDVLPARVRAALNQ